MGFVKIGDSNPVIEYYNDDGKKKVCSKCGKELVIVVLGIDNQLICEDCDTDKEISE